VDVHSAEHVPGGYLRFGDEELLPGDALIEGEECHHLHARGWVYAITYLRPDGAAFECIPATAQKTQMKAAGMVPELLPGSGGLAACVRVLHGLRAGWI
jgi:hypothetical protein